MTAHTITFDADKPARIMDGTSSTHSDLGVIVSADTGKTYRFWANRSHEKRDTAWVRRGVHYGVALHDAQGRRVRDGACENLREAILVVFKQRIRVEADRAWKELEAAEAQQVAEEAKPAILTKPNTMAFAPLSDPKMAEAYRAAWTAWEEQQRTAAPYWSPYGGERGEYERIWAEARTWEGKKARVTLKDGSTRQGVVKLCSANAANGKPGIAVTVFDGYADNWCGADFLAIEDLTPAPVVEEAPAVDPMLVEANANYSSVQLEEMGLSSLPAAADEAFWGSHLTPDEAKRQIGAAREGLKALADNMAHLPGVAEDIRKATSDLFAAWSKARAAGMALNAQEA
ncbi:hypothetical protein [Sphingomonas melonis]|uniref:hypothetical protein n=1 Tax=Sphingomonas melonis TaxID=152682 RepID=UPI0035C83C7C